MSQQIIDHDDLIIRMLLNDDEQAIKILFDQYYILMSDVAFQVIHDRDLCDDLIQELFANIWIKRHSLHLHKPLSHYLIRAIINRSRNLRRDRSRAREFLTDNFTEFENSLLGAPADSSLSVHDVRILWQKAMSLMTPRTRTVILLSRKSSMSYKEIASRLGISVKTVEKNVSAGLRILRIVMKSHLKSVLLFLLMPLE